MNTEGTGAGAISVVGGAGLLSDCSFVGNSGFNARIISPIAFSVLGVTFSMPLLQNASAEKGSMLWIGTLANTETTAPYTASIQSLFCTLNEAESSEFFCLSVVNPSPIQLNVSLIYSSLLASGTGASVFVAGNSGNNASNVALTISNTAILPDISCTNSGLIHLGRNVSIPNFNCSLLINNINNNDNNDFYYNYNAGTCAYEGGGVCALCAPVLGDRCGEYDYSSDDGDAFSRFMRSPLGVATLAVGALLVATAVGMTVGFCIQGRRHKYEVIKGK